MININHKFKKVTTKIKLKTQNIKLTNKLKLKEVIECMNYEHESMTISYIVT